MIHEEGWDQFYDIKDAALLPAQDQPFSPKNYHWLDAIQQQEESTGDPQSPCSAKLSIQGVSCAGCIWLIEKIFSKHSGGHSIRVSASDGSVEIKWLRGELNIGDFARSVQKFGYLLGPGRKGGAPSADSRMNRLLGIAGALAMNAMLFSLPRYLGLEKEETFYVFLEIFAMLFATLSMLTGGFYFIKRAYLSLMIGEVHMDFPISLGVTAAWMASIGGWAAGMPQLVYFDFVSIFIFLMLSGRWLQERLLEHNQNRIRDYLARDEIIVKHPDREEPLGLDHLADRTAYRAKNSQKLPING